MENAHLNTLENINTRLQDWNVRPHLSQTSGCDMVNEQLTLVSHTHLMFTSLHRQWPDGGASNITPFISLTICNANIYTAGFPGNIRCCASVADSGQTSPQHWVSASCFLGLTLVLLESCMFKHV